jgi:5'-3' exonuclease
MKTIPGRLYRYTPQNPSKGEVQEITHEYARQWFLFQTIQGDSTDNFEGIGTKGWGPKTIDKWITKEGGYTWENVVKLYKQHGKTEEDAIQCARMARILTDNLYNEETGEITYWTPEHLLVPFKDEIVVDVL